MQMAVMISLAAGSAAAQMPSVSVHEMAVKEYGADASWFERNIPFLEIDDAEIQGIYYYRWKLYRSHVRQIGAQGVTVTEFLDNVPWARQPFTDLNDSASFHLMEGRWLRDTRIANSLIDHLYSGGGNDRHFSESIAAATEDVTLVTGDKRPALRHLDTMQYIYNQWDDHFDRTRNLYWVEPLSDATEYSIASIDASGAGFTETPSKDQDHNGFSGGYAFRPSINSYQFANAQAIARIARSAGKMDVSEDYARRAEAIRKAVLEQLWNPKLQHFTDRYQRTTNSVTAGEFIRGRELVGYVPWLYLLPPQGDDYSSAWKHALLLGELGGAKGLRTVEPTYARYMAQYRYDAASNLPECQWNGPSWPFQSSQALAAMANLLHDYPATEVTREDYIRLLRQYTHQHYLSSGHADIQEDYDPDKGGPIVGMGRSHHYNHSSYVDLVLGGLIGIKPRMDEVLEIDPLITRDGVAPIRYFALEKLAYHGHEIGVVYDRDGTKYGRGVGLSVFVDRRLAWGPGKLGRVEVSLAKTALTPLRGMPVDLAVNVGVTDGPLATASSNMKSGAAMQAIDGRMWFFPEIANGWSPASEDSAKESWLAVDFRRSVTLRRVEIYFLADGRQIEAPPAYRLEYRDSAGWVEVPGQRQSPTKPLANGENMVRFPAVKVQEMRVVMTNPTRPKSLRLLEFEAFAQ